MHPPRSSAELRGAPFRIYFPKYETELRGGPFQSSAEDGFAPPRSSVSKLKGKLRSSGAPDRIWSSAELRRAGFQLFFKIFSHGAPRSSGYREYFLKVQAELRGGPNSPPRRTAELRGAPKSTHSFEILIRSSAELRGAPDFTTIFQNSIRSSADIRSVIRVAPRHSAELRFQNIF